MPSARVSARASHQEDRTRGSVQTPPKVRSFVWELTPTGKAEYIDARSVLLVRMLLKIAREQAALPSPSPPPHILPLHINCDSLSPELRTTRLNSCLPSSSGLPRHRFPVYTCTSKVPVENSLISFVLFSLFCFHLEMTWKGNGLLQQLRWWEKEANPEKENTHTHTYRLWESRARSQASPHNHGLPVEDPGQWSVDFGGNFRQNDISQALLELSASKLLCFWLSPAVPECNILTTGSLEPATSPKEACVPILHTAVVPRDEWLGNGGRGQSSSESPQMSIKLKRRGRACYAWRRPHSPQTQGRPQSPQGNGGAVTIHSSAVTNEICRKNNIRSHLF